MDLKEFNDLINLGRVTKDVKIGGHAITLATLTSMDYNRVMGRIGDDLPQSKRMETVQREMVAAAIQSIDDKDMDHDSKVQLLSLGQLGLSNLLYIEYMTMVEEQTKLIEDAKKNSSAATKP